MNAIEKRVIEDRNMHLNVKRLHQFRKEEWMELGGSWPPFCWYREIEYSFDLMWREHTWDSIINFEAPMTDDEIRVLARSWTVQLYHVYEKIAVTPEGYFACKECEDYCSAAGVGTAQHVMEEHPYWQSEKGLKIRDCGFS